jgi:predicted transposase YdaD
MRRKKADRIVRVYEQDPDAVLGGGLATLPLAPLTNVSGDAVQGVVDRMKERIDREASRADGGELWAATYVLMGLRYPAELVEQLLKGARGLEDSVTYQALIARGEARGKAEGRAEEARNLVLRLGSKRFGPPDAAVAAAVAAVDSVERLERMAERLLEVESWDELLA